MTSVINRVQLAVVSPSLIRRVLDLGRTAATLLEAIPRQEAMEVRGEMVRLADALCRSPRAAVCPVAAGAVGREVHRIGRRLAEVLCSTPPASRPWVWACFSTAVRERQEVDEFVAEWAIAYRE